MVGLLQSYFWNSKYQCNGIDKEEEITAIRIVLQPSNQMFSFSPVMPFPNLETQAFHCSIQCFHDNKQCQGSIHMMVSREIPHDKDDDDDEQQLVYITTTNSKRLQSNNCIIQEKEEEDNDDVKASNSIAEQSFHSEKHDILKEHGMNNNNDTGDTVHQVSAWKRNSFHGRIWISRSTCSPYVVANLFCSPL
jgi:hypothetical protein